MQLFRCEGVKAAPFKPICVETSLRSKNEGDRRVWLNRLLTALEWNWAYPWKVTEVLPVREH